MRRAQSHSSSSAGRGHHLQVPRNHRTGRRLQLDLEGPGNENSIARLSNGSLVAVLRMKFDTLHTHSLSLDGTGRTWTLPTELPGMGCCRPRLLRLGEALLLTGGRCTPTGPAENIL